VRERGIQLVLIVVLLALASGCRSNHAPHSSKVFEHLSPRDRIEPAGALTPARFAVFGAAFPGRRIDTRVRKRPLGEDSRRNQP
jgi:hypothetical protein